MIQSSVRFLLTVLLCSLAQALPAQDQFIDPRDGQIYELIEVDGKMWFDSNLRFRSQDSYCNQKRSKKVLCEQGNYYRHTELDSVCPTGTHLLTSGEWLELFGKLFEEAEVTAQDIEIRSSYQSPYLYVKEKKEEMDIFKSRLINLYPTGWIQGKKWHLNKTALHYWVQHPDKKMHLHIGKYGFNRHTHKHHIEDVPRKNRRFAVRCILD